MLGLVVIIAERGVVGDVFGAHGRAVETEDATAMQDAVDDRVGEVVVMKHGAPALGMLVGREDHRALLDVALVDDVEEHVRGVVAVREVAHLVNEEDVRLDATRGRGLRCGIAGETQASPRPLVA